MYVSEKKTDASKNFSNKNSFYDIAMQYSHLVIKIVHKFVLLLCTYPANLIVSCEQIKFQLPVIFLWPGKFSYKMNGRWLYVSRITPLISHLHVHTCM